MTHVRNVGPDDTPDNEKEKPSQNFNEKVLEPERKFCPNCGARLNDAGICPECNKNIISTNKYFRVAKNENNSLEIDFNVLENDIIPDKLQNFYTLAEDANNVIFAMDIEAANKQNYIDQLLGIAQVGLGGNTPKPELATKSLIKLKETIMINEGGKIKNKHFKKLGIAALIIGLLAAAIGGVFLYLAKYTSEPIDYFRETNLYAYFFILAGAMAGSWISFGVRKSEIKFKELAVIEGDRLNCVIRLLFIGVVSIVFVLFLKSSLITLEVGNLNIDTVMENVEAQLLVGSIAGLLGNALASRLYNIAGEFINENQK